MPRIAPAISARHVAPEIMDDPDLDTTRHTLALNGLARLNRFSRSASLLWQPIKSLVLRDAIAPVSVLDIACGAGDNLLRIDTLARKAGIEVRLAGCDISATAISHANSQAQKSQARIDWHQCDVLTDGIGAHYDVVMCSLFMHHLSHKQQVHLLTLASSCARRMIIIVDLERCLLGFLLAWAASRALTRSDVVHTDALYSVNAALTVDEARDVLADAGLTSAQVQRRWPFRWVATWNRDVT